MVEPNAVRFGGGRKADGGKQVVCVVLPSGMMLPKYLQSVRCYHFK
jgi:hypothetical protein